jgi:hypothetical protein
MAVVTTGSFAKALWPGVNTWYGQAYKEYPVEWDKLFDKYTSKRAFEEDVGVSGFGLAVVKPEGDGITYDTQKQAFITRYTHVVYALGFIVTREMFDDDLYDVVGQRKAKALAFSMRQTKETVGANVYNRAFSTSYLGGDGSTLVASAGGGGSSTHPNFAGGTWTNGPSAAVDISEAALEQACIDIAAFTNDRGLKIAYRPQTLIVPKELEFDTARIIKNTEWRPATTDRDINALATLGKFSKGMVVNHYLTDTDAWFIRTDCPDGLKYFERRGDEFGMDNDFDTENAKFKATGRYSFGWTDPRAIYGSPGA